MDGIEFKVTALTGPLFSCTVHVSGNTPYCVLDMWTKPPETYRGQMEWVYPSGNHFPCSLFPVNPCTGLCPVNVVMGLGRCSVGSCARS